MIGWMLATALALGPRPPQIVAPGEEAAYADWLAGETVKAAGGYAGKDCAKAQLQSLLGFQSDDLVARQHPQTFLYVEMVGIRGCGAANQQNLIVLRADQGWRAIQMLPGDSRASLSLQKDVLSTVVGFAAAQAVRTAVCLPEERAKSTAIVDTRVTRPTPHGQPWSERWFVRMCGGDYPQDIDFTPTPADGGTDYSVHAPQTR